MQPTHTPLPLGVSKPKSPLPGGEKCAVGFIARCEKITPDLTATMLRQITALNHLFEARVIELTWGRTVSPFHRSCK